MPTKVVNTASPAKAKTRKYKLLAGKHFGRDENGDELAYEKGEMVPLTDAQYENFKDKFEAPKSSDDDQVLDPVENVEVPQKGENKPSTDPKASPPQTPTQPTVQQDKR